MVKLNLPSFEFEVKKEADKLFIRDVLRRKYVQLTPEEWVRQHFVHYLLDHLQYPKSLIKVEGGLRFNRLQKRTDIVVFNRRGTPWMVIECKAPDQKLSHRTLHQASVYNDTLHAQYLTVTNGLRHVCYAIDWDTNKVTVLPEMPAFERADDLL